MSKIKIEQVDRLDEERKVVKYKDLKDRDAFIMAGSRDQCLRIKTPGGHVWFGGISVGTDVFFHDQEVIPVKAKILWCYEGGGE